MHYIKNLIPEHIISLNKFCYTNKEGGTGLSDSSFDGDEKWSGESARFFIVRQWDDYECGQRGWAMPDQSNKDLMDYLKRNAKEGVPDPDDLDAWNEENGVYIIFWSEFDIIK